MRTVFANSMVAHVWASQSQSYGRSHNGNFYFRDRCLYSYGSHFTVAKFLPEDVTFKGQRVVLFTSRNYSVSTSQHKSCARGALNGLPVKVILVDNPDRDYEFNLRVATAEITDLMGRSKRARKEGNKNYYANSALSIAEHTNNYASILDKPLPFPAGCDLVAAAQQVVAQENERRAAERAAREADQAAKKVLAEQALAEWVQGQHGTIPPQHGYYGILPTKVRVKDDRLMTSRGAEVPLSDAIRVFRMAARWKAGERPSIANRERAVGSFTLIGFTADGDIKVGCHTIEFSEAERMARELGLLVH